MQIYYEFNKINIHDILIDFLVFFKNNKSFKKSLLFNKFILN